MKKLFLKVFIISQLLFLLIFTSGAFANCPGPSPYPPDGPPDPGTGTGGSKDNNKNGAPIDDGTSILLVLGVAYGCFTVYKMRKKKDEEKEEELTV